MDREGIRPLLSFIHFIMCRADSGFWVCEDLWSNVFCRYMMLLGIDCIVWRKNSRMNLRTRILFRSMCALVVGKGCCHCLSLSSSFSSLFFFPWVIWNVYLASEFVIMKNWLCPDIVFSDTMLWMHCYWFLWRMNIFTVKDVMENWWRRVTS